MSDCCNKSIDNHAEKCPQCGITSKSVALQTLYHNVRFPENQKIVANRYYYCPERECKTGYFSLSSIIIPKQHLRALQQIRDGWLCYCFDISEAQYLSALKANTSEPIKSFVTAQTQSGTCACAIRNPSGKCCLGKFKKLEMT